MTARAKDQDKAVGVLTSGGVESAAMLAEAVQRYERVYPIYVRKGFIWETVELAYLRKRLLPSFRSDGLAPLDHGLTGLAPLTVLEAPVRSLYRDHWSLGRQRVPGSKAPDAAVYLPGRNLLLLSLAGLFCSLHRIPALWVGVLKGNPFRDARTGFIRQVETLVQEGAGKPLRIAAPLREFTKGQVIRHWSRVPWEKTFSCLKPANHRHCGRCQKCGERKSGFKAAGVNDPTDYAR